MLVYLLLGAYLSLLYGLAIAVLGFGVYGSGFKVQDLGSLP